MSEHYNQNYTREEVEVILNKIKGCIKDNQYIISQNQNRLENIQFINEYRLDEKKRKDILLSIEINDFCHSLNNTNQGYEHEVLYVFCPQRYLFDAFGEEEFVDIYIKFNIIEYRNSKKRVVTISFHKRNKPIDYLFR
ncbi:hypothetical protein P5E62_09110 [Clostridium perfringens]|uniref:hypothetical protein n=1 Tax=Clostridium perfringens TaxID=1502 RepID=UPI002A2FDC13|nr:hypothetical protein [Clostridium perfringens]MDK0709969.1 hypothetical protein [Clostridium perfringens]MDK0712290.1 hypothetical protein [Clostridium perfringens]MDZ5129253.1 hypothetical protein [Clostridium perfringens]